MQKVTIGGIDYYNIQPLHPWQPDFRTLTSKCPLEDLSPLHIVELQLPG
jgi:hypothetical protein